MTTSAVIRGANGSKAWDKALFVLAVASTVVLCVQFCARPPSRAASIATSLCATGGLLIGIAHTEHPELTYLLWEGFGLSVALGAACVSVFLWRGIDRVQSSRALRTVLMIAIALIAACDLASLFRTLSFFADAKNNVFPLNEMLAPAAGKVPDATFVPQYATLYGWLLVPLRSVVSPWGLAQLAVVFLSCLAVLSVLLAVTIAARTMPSPSLWLAAGILVPLACVTGLHGAATFSSINSYLQELPIRIFPNMLLSFLGIEELARLRSGSVRRWHLPALGVLAGLIAWNSQDFGLAVTIAYCILLAVGLPRGRIFSSLLEWTAGLVAGLAVYPTLALLAGTPIQLSDFALFSRAYAGGFYSFPIWVPGPVLVVLPLLLASAGVGWCLLWRRRLPPLNDSAAHDRAILTLALVGTWGIAGFIYYLNRSYASAQLQILLVPCGVCIVALISLRRDARVRVGDRRSRAGSSLRTSLSLFPLALLASLGFASMLQTPNPVTVAKNLTRARARDEFNSQLIPLSEIREAEAYAHTRGGTLGYFGNNASYVHLTTGLPSTQLFDDPVQLVASPTLRAKACSYLEAQATRWILISPTDQPLAAIDLCGLYRPVNPAGLSPGLLFVRKR